LRDYFPALGAQWNSRSKLKHKHKARLHAIPMIPHDLFPPQLEQLVFPFLSLSLTPLNEVEINQATFFLSSRQATSSSSSTEGKTYKALPAFSERRAKIFSFSTLGIQN
jgi:hypothetical protein